MADSSIRYGRSRAKGRILEPPRTADMPALEHRSLGPEIQVQILQADEDPGTITASHNRRGYADLSTSAKLLKN